MYITFRNSSTSEQMNLFFEGKTYCIDPSDCVEVFTDKTEPVFSVWLKDNCSDEQSDAKEYEDYRNPLVFKVTENAE